jgi:pimeloyl-ACP methyl ester carboxylesterase
MTAFEIGAPGRAKATAALAACLLVTVLSMLLASLVQRDLGAVAVTNVRYPNVNGVPVRAKLLKPRDAAPDNRMPGVAFIHGYQSTRESGDAYCIELARRGFVVLNIDALGRGNSGLPGERDDPGFDETFGGRSSLAYLRSLPFVDPERIGVIGHSMGAEMMYRVALDDPGVKAVILIGFGYTLEATPERPKNMLMIFGRWDEFRRRMTGTGHFVKEWMSTPQSRRAIANPAPQFGVTYGDFDLGTARRVVAPATVHVLEPHNRRAVAEALSWMRRALVPDETRWIDARKQMWEIKEWATLVAMLACFASLGPLGLLLLGTAFFRPIAVPLSPACVCGRATFVRGMIVNGLLMWLYLPLSLVLFAVHAYVVRIDRAFPMIIVDCIVWWFLWTNLIGALLVLRWYRRRARNDGVTLADMGVSFGGPRFALDWGLLGKTALLGLILCGAAYATEHVLEALLIVDFRFIFPFANDLTGYRVLMVLLYFPFLLAGFVLLGFFLYGQLRLPRAATLLRTFGRWSVSYVLVMITPLLLMLAVQYVPLFLADTIPLVGPGSMLVLLLINAIHVVAVLVMMIPLSTWFFLLTGRPYLGAFVNALLVAWMFASSQVIAPVPISSR